MVNCCSISVVMIVALLFVFTSTEMEAVGATHYVAPDLINGMSSRDQQYLIGVVSFFFVALAGYLAVRSLMVINYDDDTLLMVEVPEEVHHDEEHS